MNNKIPPPIVTLIFGCIIYFTSPFFPTYNHMALDIISFLFLLCGIIILRLAFLSFRNHKTTINPLNLTKSSSLVNNGLFKYSRNPMYLSMLLILLSIAVKFNLYGGLIMCLLFFFFITKFQIIPEEKAMTKLFGKEFDKYKKKTRRWL